MNPSRQSTEIPPRSVIRPARPDPNGLTLERDLPGRSRPIADPFRRASDSVRWGSVAQASDFPSDRSRWCVVRRRVRGGRAASAESFARVPALPSSGDRRARAVSEIQGHESGHEPERMMDALPVASGGFEGLAASLPSCRRVTHVVVGIRGVRGIASGRSLLPAFPGRPESMGERVFERPSRLRIHSRARPPARSIDTSRSGRSRMSLDVPRSDFRAAHRRLDSCRGSLVWIQACGPEFGHGLRSAPARSAHLNPSPRLDRETN